MTTIGRCRSDGRRGRVESIARRKTAMTTVDAVHLTRRDRRAKRLPDPIVDHAATVSEANRRIGACEREAAATDQHGHSSVATARSARHRPDVTRRRQTSVRES